MHLSKVQHVYWTHHYNETVHCVEASGALNGTDRLASSDDCLLRRNGAEEDEAPDEGWVQRCCSPTPPPEGGFSMNVSRTRSHSRMAATWLREDPLYYNLYCLGLNTVFATAVPFLLLLYFNVSTVIALTRMGARVSEGVKNRVIHVLR